MPYRRYPMRRRSFGRKRHRFLWARETLNTAAPVLPIAFDLLATWKTANNFTLNLPDIAIWRIHLKISIDFRFTAAGDPLASSGFFVGVYTGPKVAVVAASSLNQYEWQYMMWDKLYASETLKESYSNINVTTTNQQVIYKEYDIKTRRLLTNQDDTLFLTIESEGDASVANGSIDFTHSTLLRLP